MSKLKSIKLSFSSELSENEINNILERIFWDGEYFEIFKDSDWVIK